MRYHVIACDYDGTLATSGLVEAEVIASLQRVRESGRRLILVTGRELDQLLEIFPDAAIFDWVVAENGAVAYCPGTREETLLADPPPRKFGATLRERGVEPLSEGRVIVATWEPHEVIALEVIRDLGLELQVVFNKGAVMVLPSGVQMIVLLQSHNGHITCIDVHILWLGIFWEKHGYRPDHLSRAPIVGLSVQVRKNVLRKGKRHTEWVAMRKGVAYLFRYREVSLQANGRYLDALAVVEDPTNAKRALDRVTTPKKDAAGRGCSGFNPLARHDSELFQTLMAGEHCLRGFSNRDIRARLASTVHLRSCGQDSRKESAKVSRTFRRFHAHGLIAKIQDPSLAGRTPSDGAMVAPSQRCTSRYKSSM